jgi:hypothetical protein
MNGLVLQGSTPELFRSHLREAIQIVQSRQPDHRLIFVKSWNEWAEGNYLEPDLHFGTEYLSVMRDELCSLANAEGSHQFGHVTPQSAVEVAV